MIRLENMSFKYASEQTENKQLKNINIEVQRGEFILLTGKSGCGKTTLTRILNGLCPNFFNGKMSGKYFLNGKNSEELSIDEIGTMIGSVFQDPRSQFFATNTLDEIVLGMENNAVPRELMQKRLREAVQQTGVEHLLGKSIFQLSSGEKQRIAIASVCAMQPPVLVLDEPSANLDSDAIERLSHILFRLKEKGTTIILSEHRLHYVRDIFDKLVLMDNGQIKEEYSSREILALENKELIQKGLRSFIVPRLLPGKNVTAYESEKLRAHKVSLFWEGKEVLNEVELAARSGKILAITGGNGAGKTSLCRILSGLKKPHVGQTFIDGIVHKRKQLIRKTFFVQQDTDYQLYGAEVGEEFRIGKAGRALSENAIIKGLRNANLDKMLHRHPLSLSGGQKQRLLLTVASMSNREILLLDEPTSGLDGENMRKTAEYLKQLSGSGKCIILVTHDIEFLSLAADSILYLNNGKIGYHKEL